MRRTLARLVILAAAFALLGLVARRPTSSATYDRFAVAADHPVASDAGKAILDAGGNAADAAVATMLALGVASPASSGLGGGGFALYYRASDRSLTFLDFRETAPAAATATMFARREGEDDRTAAARSMTGGLAVAVPGEAAGMEELLRRFGSQRVTRAAIAAPAERAAREGVPASRIVSDYSASFVDLLRTDRVLASWIPEGSDRVPIGQSLANPELAATLRTFGRQGARPFYRGAIANAIALAVQRTGGVMTAADLAGYTVLERAALVGERFGRRWVTAPPPSAGGFTLLHSLALLERWQPEGGWRDDTALRHAFAESWIGAYVDRASYLGDPSQTSVPIDALLAPERLERRAAVFDPQRAVAAAEWALPLTAVPASSATQEREGGTSHLCIVDAEGNVASITTTINLPFGARVTAAGIVLNDEMDDFAREVGAANAFGLPGGAANLPSPGRRPLSSMAPTIVFDGEAPVLCVGGSGGSRIPTAATQVAFLTLLLGHDVGSAVRAPRVHHQGIPGALSAERGMDSVRLSALWRRGHDLAEVETSANVQAIQIERVDGATVLHAASDPRKDARPSGR